MLTYNAIMAFIAITIINVVASTIKSIITVKGNPLTASLTNAFYYSIYVYVMIFTVEGGLPTWAKALITFGCNFIGVFLVKYVESKREKTKLWLCKMTVPAEAGEFVKKRLKDKDISNTYYEFPQFTVFDCFCASREETQAVVQLCKAFDGKMFASENKLDF